MIITTSSPGSMMLMGEHAVLHGYPALVAAVDARVTVCLHPRSDQRIRIDCEFGCYEAELGDWQAEPPFDLVMTVLSAFSHHMDLGCDIRIDSTAMPTAMGIGSSTAVAVAVTAALQQWLHQTFDRDACFNSALASIRRYQGSCSGADVAASVYGGVLSYCNAPLHIDRLPWLPKVVVLYSGHKMKTADVVKHVQNRFQDRQDALQALYRRIGACVNHAIQSISDQPALEACITENQMLMQDLGLVNERLEKCLAFCQQQPGIRTVKISGAGLGDCVIGFGSFEQNDVPYEVVPVQFSAQGVQVG